MEGSHNNEGDRTVPVQFYRGARGFKPFKNPPQPHMCIQDSIKNTSELLYINVLSWKQIANIQQYTDPIPLYGGIQIHQGCAPNSNKPPLIVFAVMANPEILKINGKHATNPMEREAFVTLLCEFVEAMNPGLQLARSPVVLKDRDLAGELKDVWLAVQAQREREKLINQESNSQVTHKIYHIDGPSENTPDKNNLTDNEDYKDHYYNDEMARENKMFRTDLKDYADSTTIDTSTSQISDQNTQNSMKENSIEKMSNKNVMMDKSQSIYSENERFSSSVIFSKDFPVSNDSDMSFYGNQKNYNCDNQSHNKDDFRDLSFANKCGSLSNYDPSDIISHSSVSKMNSKLNEPLEGKNLKTDLESQPSRSTSCSSEYLYSKNDKIQQNGNGSKQPVSPSHIPIKKSNAKRKNIVKSYNESSKPTDFYPNFDNLSQNQETTPIEQSSSRGSPLSADHANTSTLNVLMNAIKVECETSVSTIDSNLTSNIENQATRLKNDENDPSAITKSVIDQIESLKINGNNKISNNTDVVGNLIQNLNFTSSAESAPSLGTATSNDSVPLASQ